MSFRIFKILTLIFSLFCSITVSSQNYNIKHYTIEDGLLHSFVNDIIQDSQAYIWLATGGGLSKFDGKEFTNYTMKNGLISYRLVSLCEDNESNIWIGSSAGINVLHKDSIYAFKSADFNVLAFEKSENGGMWVMTSKGIFLFGFGENKIVKKQQLMSFEATKDFANIFQDRNNNYFLLETKNNSILAGVGKKLYKFSGGKSEIIKLPDNLIAYSAVKLPDNTIFLGTNNGIYQFSKSKLVSLNNPNQKSFSVFKLKYKDNKFWAIGNWDDNKNTKQYLLSLSLTDLSYFRKISDDNGLIDKPTSLMIDRENNVWVSSIGGVSVLKGEQFVNYTEKNGLAGNKIWGVYQDKYKNIWAGTINQGLSVITSDNKIFRYDTTNGLPCMYVSSVLQFSNTKYLIGTSRKGLCFCNFDNETKKCTFYCKDIPVSKPKVRIDCIVKDKNNRIWIGGNKGLFYSYDAEKFYRKKLNSNDTGQYNVQKVYVKSNGDIYVGVRNKGLFIIKNDSVIKTNINTGIISITEDKFHNIWLGAQYKGIYNFTENNGIWINEQKGLKSNLIYILQADKIGNLWVGTNLGLDKIDLERYYSKNKLHIRHYDKNDGLNALEMNLNGSIVDSEGNLWFASNNGLLRYDAKYDLSNRVPPVINLISVSLFFNKINDWSQFTDSEGFSLKNQNSVPHFKYNQNHITFDFVALSYKKPDEILYSWKLEGFDNEWVAPNNNQRAVYSNLPDGKYRFLLKSANNDGVWTPEYAEFKFYIEAPLWKKWWFILLIIITVVLLIYVYIKIRIRNLQKQKIQLEEQVKTRTKELYLHQEELKAKIEIVYKQKQEIENIHLRLSDSIEYAKRIQSSLLPDINFLDNYFLGKFLLFKPLDVVSGDFYWFTKTGNKIIISVADCTGHGVPGAFMSMLGISFLKEIVEKEQIVKPAEILNKIREYIIDSFKQSGKIDEQKDGIDMSIVSIDLETNTMEYAGANNQIYLVKKNKIGESVKKIKLHDCSLKTKYLYEFEPDKMPVSHYRRMEKFENISIKISEGDIIYLFSDGYADQFGGKKNQKFMVKRFRNLICDISDEDMRQQQEILQNTLTEWKGDSTQIDDITVLSIKI